METVGTLTDYGTDTTTSAGCRTCERFVEKDGASCAGCPAFKDTHYLPRSEGFDAPDVFILGDVHEPLAQIRVKRDADNHATHHVAFEDDGGKIVKTAVTKLLTESFMDDGKKMQPSPYRAIQVRYAYAVKCAVESPNKEVIDHCSTPMRNEMGKVHQARKLVGKIKPLIVVATGKTALHSLGIRVQNFEEDAAGRTFNINLGAIPLVVVATMSLKAMAAQAGKASSIVADIRRAFELSLGREVKVLSREEIEKNYVYPHTIEEVTALVDNIIAYNEGNITADEWAISFDTETNTLHPHRDGTKILTAQFSWAVGKSCSIPLWHPRLHEAEYKEVPTADGNAKELVHPPVVDEAYTAEEAWTQVKRLLESVKPKIGHNIVMYDSKVVRKVGGHINNIRWDCLHAEHVLEEDKKGQYGLKYLTKQYMPELSGYEDKLHEYLDNEEGEDQGKSILAAKEAENLSPIPKNILEALERCGVNVSFQIGTLAKKIERANSRIANTERIQAVEVFLKDRGMLPPYKGAAFTRSINKLTKSAIMELPGTYSVPALEFLMSIEDKTYFEPVTEADHQFVKYAELLIAAKRAGEFQNRDTDKKKSKEHPGGFEAVPLRELMFYGAVDADVTRRLAVIQRRKMHEEDVRICEKRIAVNTGLKANRDWIQKGYKINVLCREPDPLRNLHVERYLPRAQVLSDMEFQGVRINKPYLSESRIELDNVILRTEAKIYEMAGERFNIASAPQLGRYLFNRGLGFRHPDPEAAMALAADPELVSKLQYSNGLMAYEPISKTPHGAFQLNEKTLRTYITLYKCPFSDSVLLYRKAMKARDTFLKNMELFSSIDGMIHAHFNQNGTSTGRLSSSNPNLQNIPTTDKGPLGAIVDGRGKLIIDSHGKPVGPGVVCKRLFIPDDDSMCLVNADAKGAEIGVFTAYTRDEVLIKSLLEGRDTHCYFAAQALNPDKIAGDLQGEKRRLSLAQADIDDEHAWSYEDFVLGKDGLHPDKSYGSRLKKLRTNIKRVVFGVLFGAGARKIADIAGISENLSSAIIKALFDEFPSIPRFIDQTKWELRTFGFVETYIGRRRRFPWNPSLAPRKMLAKAERQAVNFKIQGGNTDIIMDVLVTVAEILKRDLRGRMLMTVHDSLVFQVPKIYASQIKDLMYQCGTKQVAEKCPWLPVPFKWDVTAGPTYGDQRDIDDYVNALPPPSAAALEEEERQGLAEAEIFSDLREAVWIDEVERTAG